MAVENDLGRDSVRSLVWRIAIPSMLGQFVSVLYSIVDRIYIGFIPEVGDLALAGAGVCGPVVTMIGSVASLIGVGGAPLVSIRMGEGNLKEARRVLSNCVLMLWAASLVITLGILPFREPMLTLFGASAATYPYAESYFTAYVCGTIFALTATGLNQFVICQGFAKVGMGSVMLGAALNILLDPVFIFALDLGVQGAAIATVISQAASALFVVLFLFGKRAPVSISFGGYSAKIMARVLMMGFTPFLIIAIDNVMIIAGNAVLQAYGGPEEGDALVTCNTIVQSFMLVVTMPLGGISGGTQGILGYNYGAGNTRRVLQAYGGPGEGDALVTCNTIVQSFMLVVTMPLGGISGGTQGILGYNYGAGNTRRVLQAQKYIVGLCVGYTALLFLLARLAGPLFVQLFTRDQALSQQALEAIHISTLAILPLGVQYELVDGFTGMGQVQFSLPLSFWRKLVYFVAIFSLPALFGARAVFYAEPISDVLGPLVTILVYACTIRKVLRKREALLASHRA